MLGKIGDRIDRSIHYRHGRRLRADKEDDQECANREESAGQAGPDEALHDDEFDGGAKRAEENKKKLRQPSICCASRTFCGLWPQKVREAQQLKILLI